MTGWEAKRRKSWFKTEDCCWNKRRGEKGVAANNQNFQRQGTGIRPIGVLSREEAKGSWSMWGARGNYLLGVQIGSPINALPKMKKRTSTQHTLFQGSNTWGFQQFGHCQEWGVKVHIMFQLINRK